MKPKKTNPKELIEAYGKVFDTDHGRLVLRDILSQAGVWRQGFFPNPNELYFQEGRRSIGQYLLFRMKEHNPAKMQALLGGCSPTPEKAQEAEQDE